MIDGLEFTQTTKTAWSISFHGNNVGRIRTDAPNGPLVYTHMKMQELQTSARCEVVKLAWEFARVQQITARLLA